MIEEEYGYYDFQIFEFDYSQANTRDLLKALHNARVDLSYYDYISDYDEDKSKLIKIYKALKDELATREHIPTNKKERKKIRQEKFKLKKT